MVEPILAYFDDRVTNSFAEGITNKIKVMKRRSYGFRDPIRYRHKGPAQLSSPTKPAWQPPSFVKSPGNGPFRPI